MNKEIHKLLRLLYDKENNLTYFNGDEYLIYLKDEEDENNIDKYLINLLKYINKEYKEYDKNKKEENLDKNKKLFDLKNIIDNMNHINNKNNKLELQNYIHNLINRKYFKNNYRLTDYLDQNKYFDALKEIEEILKLINLQILAKLKKNILDIYDNNDARKLNDFINKNFIDNYLLIFKNNELKTYLDIGDYNNALYEIFRIEEIINSDNPEIPLKSNIPILEDTTQQIIPKSLEEITNPNEEISNPNDDDIPLKSDISVLEDTKLQIIPEITDLKSLLDDVYTLIDNPSRKPSLLDKLKNNKLIKTYSHFCKYFLSEKYENLVDCIIGDIDSINYISKSGDNKYKTNIINYFHENMIERCSPANIIKNIISKFLKEEPSTQIENMNLFKQKILEYEKSVLSGFELIDKFKNENHDNDYNKFLIRRLQEYLKFLDKYQYGGLKKYTLKKL